MCAYRSQISWGRNLGVHATFIVGITLHMTLILKAMKSKDNSENSVLMKLNQMYQLKQHLAAADLSQNFQSQNCSIQVLFPYQL